MSGYEAFSPEWAAAWCAALNASEGYRRAAATWEGAVALVLHPDPALGMPERRAVFLDLWRGACRAARPATDEDLATAAYTLEAGAAAWRDLLDGRTSPVMAIMTGKLQLTRGSLASLLPYAGAASELVTVAAGIRTTFPATA